MIREAALEQGALAVLQVAARGSGVSLKKAAREAKAEPGRQALV